MTFMKLHNTLTRQIEEIQPINPPNIGLYACGFTVYDYTHLGHLRKYSMDDVLVRTLRHAGYKVNFVQNVTDVGHLTSDADTGEDKLEKGARKYGKSVWDIAKEFEEYFYRSMELMGNVKPDVVCRATEHIEEQLQMVVELEKKGFAYVIDGDGVYFDTSKFADYGKLAKLNLEDQKEGARVEVVAGKRNPTDFVLWKFEREGENRQMVWESPWHKRSFPGWHIECSAMSIKYLGDQFDIHTGGIDHIPVHHTNEIAQAESATGKIPFVKYWVHHNFLKVDGEKMSKSLDNFFTIDDVLEKGFHPRALRLLFLTAHYRSEMNFTWENLAGMHKRYVKLLEQVVELEKEDGGESGKGGGGGSTTGDNNSEGVQNYSSRFFTALENDLDTPGAIVILWEVLKSNLSSEEKHRLLLDFDQVLNLGLTNAIDILVELKPDTVVEEIPVEIEDILSQRAQARAEKNYQKADELRDLLQEKGYQVIDEGDDQKLLNT
jgi:cysteinyl-tRNA synthetase